jgi:hypothetical protein
MWMDRVQFVIRWICVDMDVVFEGYMRIYGCEKQGTGVTISENVPRGTLSFF